MTIKDIATIAGVSVTTVSLVLNNKADSISEETREKVLRVIKEYNFKPYAKVIQNTSAHSGLIGLLIPGNASDFIDFISGAQKVACAEGYSMIFCPSQDEREETKQLNHLFAQNVDGIACYLDRKIDFERMFTDAPEKLLYTAASNCKAWSGQCSAYCAFSDAAHMAVEHLIDFGHREIALLGHRNHFLTEDLITGYNKALYDHGIVPQDGSVFLCDSAEDVMNHVRQIICGNSTAFLCQDTKIAAYVYRVLSRYGLQIPKNYSVISISDHSVSLDAFESDLTTVDIQLQELGQAVMESLIYGIEGRTKASDSRNITPQLRAGASVEFPTKSTGKGIVVVGSMNTDIIIRMPHIPTSGESLLSQRIINLPGGKGANQAVGAAKLGGDIYAIGCLGDDQEGRLLYNSLVENGVNTVGVRTVQNIPTGKAYILVAENADSTIVYSYGANGELRPDIVEQNVECFQNAEYCLLSTEIPWEAVLSTIDLCIQNGVKILLKPTVQWVIPPEILKHISYLVPNEKELEVQVAGMQSVEEKAASLFAAGAENVIVTLGEKGCYLHNREMARHFPAADFQAVDTTGAGDAFISAFAVYLSENHDIVSAIQFATYAAGLSVTRDGVQSALADRLTLENALQ